MRDAYVIVERRTRIPFERQIMLTASPLPTVESPQFKESGLGELANAISVYRRILEAEARAVQDGADENVISARVIGYLLLELYARCPTLGDQACSKVIQEVISLSQDSEHDEHDVVLMVGKRHRDHLIRGCRLDYLSVLFKISVASSQDTRQAIHPAFLTHFASFPRHVDRPGQ